MAGSVDAMGLGPGQEAGPHRKLGQMVIRPAFQTPNPPPCRAMAAERRGGPGRLFSSLQVSSQTHPTATRLSPGVEHKCFFPSTCSTFDPMTVLAPPFPGPALRPTLPWAGLHGCGRSSGPEAHLGFCRQRKGPCVTFIAWKHCLSFPNVSAPTPQPLTGSP